MKLIAVTPIHNEAENIGLLAEQLAASSRKPDLWVVVDDGSTDLGPAIVLAMDLPFEVTVFRRKNDGGLIAGSAFKAWQAGLDSVEDRLHEFDAIMKLDADVNLPTQYLETMAAALIADPSLGVIGGVLVGRRDREQVLHVPGPVKLYSREGYLSLRSLPREVGFDVMDELSIKSAGLKVLVRKDSPFSVRRAIGASQGLIHGRRRNGLVCRWTGYSYPYFLLHVLRYSFRAPYFIGSVAMIRGYHGAPSSPYSCELQLLHAQEQRAKLASALKDPARWLRNTYRISAKDQQVSK